MKTQLGRNRYVQIDSSIGYKDGWYLIVGENEQEFQLKHTVTQEKVTIYKAHCTKPTFTTK